MSGPITPTLSSAEVSARLAEPWSPAEREVWRILEQGLLGYSFRRHAVLNGMLVRFYCPELGLVLEIDEAGADPAVSAAQAKALDGLGIKVARLSAAEVDRPHLVEAVERVVERGRLWPED